jgi:hypothetical protein
MNHATATLLLLSAMTSCTTTGAPGSLLGADFDAVRARYGTPLACTAGGGVLQFSYPVHGVPTADAVLVVDGVVVGLRDGIEATPPTRGIAALLGAGVDQVLTQLGGARAVDVGATHSRFAFAGGEILFYEGRVVAVEPAEPSVAASS